MKKIIKTIKTILLTLCLIPTFSMAQSTVTAPTSPTIPSMNAPGTATAAASAALSGTTNKIYLDQSGSNPNVNMTQEGSGNTAGDSSRAVRLRGIDQSIITIQSGDNNTLNLEVTNATSGSSQGATVTIRQLGDSNTVDAACGYGTASDGSTSLTGCKAADLNWKFTGDSNNFQFRGTGDNLFSHVDVTGSSNTFVIDQIGSDHSQVVSLSGSSNAFNIAQKSTASGGSHIALDMTSTTGSTMNIEQSGSVNNYLNIKTSGTTGGTFNILQKN
jgi:hypothetical protein